MAGGNQLAMRVGVELGQQETNPSQRSERELNPGQPHATQRSNHWTTKSLLKHGEYFLFFITFFDKTLHYLERETHYCQRNVIRKVERSSLQKQLKI